MKSQITKHIVLIALLLAGGLSVSAQNDRANSAFAIDKNITSFEVANLIDKIICEYPPEPWESLDGFSPHFWTITLIMAEGTDITSLAPIITLAPGATIKSIETSAHGVSISPGHTGALDFSHQVDYTVIAEDGSIFIYKFLANAGKTRGQTVKIFYQPNANAGYTSPIAGTYNYNNIHSSISVYAYPYKPQYEFDKWLVTEFKNPGYNSPSTHYGDIYSKYPINYDMEIVAVFKPAPQYTVTVQSENTNKGTVYGGGTCYEGGNVYVTATPKQGYIFDGWYLNGTRISQMEVNYPFRPTESCTLIAKFKTMYTITAQSEDTNKGTVTGGGTYLEGTSIWVTAYPKTGYDFDGWYQNGMIVTGAQGYLFTVSASVTLIAKFRSSLQYTVTVQSENTTKGTVSGGGSCSPGNSVNVYAYPKSGYTIDGWYLNGVLVSSYSSFSYYPSASCTLIAKFKTSGTPPGSVPTLTISGSSSIPVNSGTTFYANTTANYSGPAITSYQWEIGPAANSFTSYGWYASAYFTTSDTYRVSCRATNSVGTGPWADFYITVGNRSTPSLVYPNPVDDVLYVEVGSSANENIQSAVTVYDIRLYDGNGTIVRQTSHRGSGTVRLDVSSLPNGIYYLHIYDGANRTPEMHQIIVRH